MSSYDVFLAVSAWPWLTGLVYLEQRYTRHGLRCDVARVLYDAGMWQTYASELLPPDHFMPLLDWNIKPWLDNGMGGGLEGDGSGMGGGFSGGAVPGHGPRPAEKKARKREGQQADRRRKEAEKLAYSAGGPEMSTPEALGRLLTDPEDVVVVAAIRCVGYLLQGLNDAGGRRFPDAAERNLLRNARRVAGPLRRLGGIRRPRPLPQVSSRL
jgi:hypothetical protein